MLIVSVLFIGKVTILVTLENLKNKLHVFHCFFKAILSCSEYLDNYKK